MEILNHIKIDCKYYVGSGYRLVYENKVYFRSDGFLNISIYHRWLFWSTADEPKGEWFPVAMCRDENLYEKEYQNIIREEKLERILNDQ